MDEMQFGGVTGERHKTNNNGRLTERRNHSANNWILLFVVDGVLAATVTLGSPMEVHLSEDELISETPVSDERHPVVGVIFRQTQQNCPSKYKKSYNILIV